METRKDERTVKISNGDELAEYIKQGYKYFAKTHYKKWNEDFVDKDTGEVVSVERSSALFQQGRELTPDVTSRVLFHIQTGDLKEVELSTQSRMGRVILDGWEKQLWQVKLGEHLGKKKLKIITHAGSAEKAVEIIRDFIELHQTMFFEVLTVKSFASSIIIEDYSQDMKPQADVEIEKAQHSEDTEQEKDPTAGANHYYKMNIRVCYGEAKTLISQEWPFVVNARDVEEANVKINKYLSARVAQEIAEKGHSDMDGYKTTTLDAQPISCDMIVPVEFSDAYTAKQEGEQ